MRRFIGVTLVIGSTLPNPAFAPNSPKQPAAGEKRSPNFTEFSSQFKRSYKGAELAKRKAAYEARTADIDAHNARGGAYRRGINRFSDESDEDLSNTYLQKLAPELFKPDDSSVSVAAATLTSSVAVTSASVFDWSSSMSAVEDQGQCGSCFAFATTATIEGRRNVALATSKIDTLSEEELLDCSGGRYGNRACSGGWMGNSYAYVRDNGLCGDKSYPYLGSKTACKAKVCPKILAKNQLTGHVTALATKLGVLAALSTGPLSVAVAASTEWFSYAGGVYTGSCGGGLNHAVSLVGYGFDTATSKYFWKVKNSCGTGWGEQGYMRIEATDDLNKCGIWNFAQFPVFATR